MLINESECLSHRSKSKPPLYLKLVREHQRLLADLWSSDHAINFSVTAQHLYKDWLKRELTEADYLQLKQSLESGLKVEMEIIRDVCDGTKHFHIDRPPHILVSKSGMQQGAFSKASRAFDVGGLILILHDNSKIYFDNVADRIIGFWSSYFDDTYNIDGE